MSLTTGTYRHTITGTIFRLRVAGRYLHVEAKRAGESRFRPLRTESPAGQKQYRDLLSSGAMVKDGTR